jgi:uncharacterized protein (TIGR04255 family)
VPADQLSSPFGTEPVEEIRLSAAPLIKVLAQIKFPSLAILHNESVTSTLAARLGLEYPVLQEQRGMNVLLTQGGLTQQPTEQRMWGLRSRDEAWKLTISENFLALETTQYPTRDEFVDRFDRAMQEFFSIVDPPYFERLGIRYIDRIDDEALINGDLRAMIRNEMAGGMGADLPPGVELQHSISDILFVGQDRSVQVRCGILPAQVTVFGLDVPAADRPTWLLDIDSYVEHKMVATSSDMTAKLRILADGAYRMFRWIINKDFLVRFGGSLND